MDRHVWLLCLLGVAYATETTLDFDMTSTTPVVSDGTQLPERVNTTFIVVNERTSGTEFPIPGDVDPATIVDVFSSTDSSPIENEEQFDSTTTVEKHLLKGMTTTKEPPQQAEVTERSSTTTSRQAGAENQGTNTFPESHNTPSSTTNYITPMAIQRTTTTTQRATTSTQKATTTSQRATETSQIPTKTTYKPSPTTPRPTRHTKKQAATHPTLSTTVRQEATTELVPPLAISRPVRKPTTVEAKKGTINTIPIQKPKKRKTSKKDNGMSSLVYIPLMIQAQMIPMMIMQLKMFALKALALGKLALIILGLNLLRNAIIGYQNDEQQYEHQSLASAHYGYNGGPEYGSWVNRRMYNSDPEFLQFKQPYNINSSNNFAKMRTRSNKSGERLFINTPYKNYEYQARERLKQYVR